MSDKGTNLRDLLDELADEARLDPTLQRTTLRRARRRRIGNAAVSVVVVVGIALGGAFAVRELRPHATPAGHVTPSVIPSALQNPTQTGDGSGNVTGTPTPSPAGAFDTDLADGRYIAFLKE